MPTAEARSDFSMTDIMGPLTAVEARDSPLSQTRPAEKMVGAFEKASDDYAFDKNKTDHMSTKVISLNNVIN